MSLPSYSPCLGSIHHRNASKSQSSPSDFGPGGFFLHNQYHLVYNFATNRANPFGFPPTPAIMDLWLVSNPQQGFRYICLKCIWKINIVRLNSFPPFSFWRMTSIVCLVLAFPGIKIICHSILFDFFLWLSPKRGNETYILSPILVYRHFRGYISVTKPAMERQYTVVQIVPKKVGWFFFGKKDRRLYLICHKKKHGNNYLKFSNIQTLYFWPDVAASSLSIQNPQPDLSSNLESNAHATSEYWFCNRMCPPLVC